MKEKIMKCIKRGIIRTLVSRWLGLDGWSKAINKRIHALEVVETDLQLKVVRRQLDKLREYSRNQELSNQEIRELWGDLERFKHKTESALSDYKDDVEEMHKLYKSFLRTSIETQDFIEEVYKK